MTVVPERVLAAHRLGRFIGRRDVADCSAAVHAITDSGVRAYIAHSIRAQALEEIYDAVSEPDCNLSAAGMMDLTKRVFAGCKERLTGGFPDDIIEQACALPGGDA